MNYKAQMFFSALIGIGFTGCEQRDDQALIKVYEVFQRDMQKRDEAAKASMTQIQDEIKNLGDKVEQIQGQAPGGGGSAESVDKLAAAVADVVGKKLAEQNAAGLAEMKAQIEQLRVATAQSAAAGQPAPIASAAVSPPAPATPTSVPGPDGVRYREQNAAPLPPPPPSSTKSSDPSRKKYRIEF